MNSTIPFIHRHAAHCESGVLSNLLQHKGLSLSEAMIFGIGGGLSFAYLPFLRMGNLPVVSYRSFPGTLIRTIPRVTGARFYRRRYGYDRQQDAMRELDATLASGQVAALQTSVYFTTYFPPEMRFQFNAHNIVIYGKEDGTYLVSDPVFDTPQRIAQDDLRKARFARGLGAPRGLMHYPVSVPASVDLPAMIRRAVKSTLFIMFAPFPLVGLKGMNLLAHTIEQLPEKHDATYSRHFLGNVVRMQEEIGTGGGGFRFVYAAFLAEAAGILGNSRIKEASQMMTAAGDLWRTFAYQCAQGVKRKREGIDFAGCARALRVCAAKEEGIYRLLKEAVQPGD